MSVDKLVDSTQLDSDLTSVANAIRTKSGGSGQLAFPSGFVSEIGNIPSGGGGIVIAPMDYSVTLFNGRTATISVVRIQYNLTTLLSATSGNIAANSSATYSGMATDGTHFWFRSGTGTTVKYNGETADFVRDGTYFQVVIPTGFDGTIPFVIS